MPGRKVPRLWRGGRHTGPRPAAVPGADERPAPHLRHDFSESERRAVGRRGGGPGEGRQVPPEPLGYSSPEPGGTTQQQQMGIHFRSNRQQDLFILAQLLKKKTHIKNRHT